MDGTEGCFLPDFEGTSHFVVGRAYRSYTQQARSGAAGKS